MAGGVQSAKIAQLQGGSGNAATIPQSIQVDFALATEHVLYAMAVIMAVAALVALRELRRGVQEVAPKATAFCSCGTQG